MAKVVGTADWRSRIGTEEGPTTMALGPQAFVQTRDPRYVSDAYQYFLNQGMGGGPDAATIPATTVAQAPAASVTTGGGGGGAGITAASVVQPTGGGAQNPLTQMITDPVTGQTKTVKQAFTDPAAYNIPGQMPKTPVSGAWGPQPQFQPQTSDPFLMSGAAGGARLPQIGYGEGQVDPGLAQAAGLTTGYPEAAQQDPTFWENARDKFVTTGQDIGGFFGDLKDKGIDIGKMAGTALLNYATKGLTAGLPILGTVAGMLPGDTSEDTWNRQFAVGGEGFQDIATSDPDLGKRLEGYSKDLIAGTGEGKDPFGRNTVSAFGDYEKRLAEDLQYTGDNQFSLDKKAYAQAYFDKKGIGLNPNEAKAFEEKYGISPTGEPVTRDRLIDEGIAAADEEDDMFEPTTVDQLEGVDPGFQTRFTAKGPDDTWMGPGELLRAPDFVTGVGTTEPEVTLGPVKPGFTNPRRPGQDVVTRDEPVELGPVQPGAGRIWPDRPTTEEDILVPPEKPVGWSELDDLEADPMAEIIDDPKVEDPSFLDRFKSDSAKEYEGYNQSEKAAVDKAYGAGGVMEGYNIVSGFGEGPKATVDERIDNFEKNWSPEKIKEMSENPNSTYSKLKDLQNKIGKPEDPVDEKIDDTDPADVGTIDTIFDDIDTGVGEFDTTPTPSFKDWWEDLTPEKVQAMKDKEAPKDKTPPGPTGKDIHGGSGDKAGMDQGGFDPGGGFVDQGGGGEFGGAPSGSKSTPSGPSYGPHQDAGGWSPAAGGGGGGGGGGGCFLKGTQVTMADGSTKAIEQVDLGDNVAKGGKVFATGKFLVENLHDYKGIKVSGSHMVNEYGNWTRVEDSKHGKPLGDDEHTVYVFGAENRRILINDILFTDYFEVNEQEKLSEGDKFFDNWKIHAKVDSDNNVNVLNAN